MKVLDFGIAKLVEGPVGGDQETVTEHTTSSAIRQPRVFDGTPGYVSPEQAAGERVDARSDIFSFGALLYEMVTGRRAFQGSSPAETIAQVMRDQPRPPSEITPGVPRDLERLILRCLRKERERRVQFMADVKVELQEIAEAPGVPQTAQRPPAHDRRLAWTAGAVLIALAIAATALFVWRGREIARPDPRVVPLTVTRGIEASPNFSPDGRQLAFAWDGEPAAAGVPTNFDLWLKLPGGSEARRLTSDAADDMGPSWSPDGRQIAFQRGRAGFPGRIYLVSPLGGAERKLTDLPAARVRDQLVSRGGRAAARVVSRRTMAGRGAGEGAGRDPPRRGRHPPRSGWRRRAATAHRPGSSAVDRDPAFSSDGRRLAYARCANDTFAACDVFVVELGDDLTPKGPARRLTRHDLTILGIAWTADQRSLVFGGARLAIAHLWRVDVDGDRPPERLEIARQGLSPSIAPAAGRLAYGQWGRDNDIYAFEPGRADVAVATSSLTDHGPTFSPDGRRIAFESGRTGTHDEIWLADADGSNPVQLTHGPGHWQGSPSWSPDGRRIVFDSRASDGICDIWTIDVDGAGLRRVTDGPLNEVMPTWSADGRWIYYQAERADGFDIWRVASTGGKAERLTHHGGFRAVESPDGRSLFFVQRDDASPLFAQPAAGGPARQVAECVISRSLAAGPDGIYYLGCPPSVPQATLFRLDPAGLTARRLGVVGIGGGFVPGMAVAPMPGGCCSRSSSMTAPT